MPRFRIPQLALLLLIALGAAACGSGGSGQGAVGGDQAPARVTPGALMAIAKSHLDLPDKLKHLSSPDDSEQNVPQSAQADLRYGGALVSVSVHAPRPVPPCFASGYCVRTKTDAGTRILSWELEAPEEDPGVVSVQLYTDTEVRGIYLSGPKITKDPRKMDLKVVGSVERMADVIEDPDFALTSTRGAVEAGRALPNWDGRDTPAPKPGPKVAWTPRALAALAGQRLWYFDREGDATAAEPAGPVGKAAGIRFNGDRDDSGGGVAMYLLPDPPAGATTCPTDFQCVRDGDLTYGWGDRSALVFRERKGFVLRTYFRQLTRDVTGPEDFSSGQLARLVAFTSDPDLGAQMSSDWIRIGRDLFYYEDAGAKN